MAKVTAISTHSSSDALKTLSVSSGSIGIISSLLNKYNINNILIVKPKYPVKISIDTCNNFNVR